MFLTMVHCTTVRMSALTSSSAALLPNPIGGAASDWFEDLANSMTDSFSQARVEIVKQLAESSLPTMDELQSDWYLTSLGGTYGLATKLIMLVLVIVAVVMALSPMSNHSLRMRRTIQSFVMVGLFGALFFPLYSLAYEGIMALQQGMTDVAIGKESSSIEEASSAMLEVFLPNDVWFRLIVSFVGLGLAYSAFTLALANYLGVLFTAMFYPLAAALRPVTEKFNTLFHYANSALITTLLTPLIITGGFLLPAYAAKAFPEIGATGIAAGIFTIIGGGIAFFGPIALAYYAFKGSKQVFGQLDFASISGSVDVNTMPPMTSRDMDDSVKESGTKAFLSSLGAGGVAAQLTQSDDVIGDLKKLGIEAASTAAAATGHPELAALLNTTDTTLTNEKRKHTAQQSHAPTHPPSVSPQPPVDEPVNPVASTPSPVQEWPDNK